MYLNFRIKVPNILENIVVYFLLRYRKKRYGVAFRRIKLIKDKETVSKYRYTIVDPEDYQKLAGYNWQLYEKKGRYVVRLQKGQIICMHRVIMNAPKGKVVDHRDGEGLNNTKQNLRIGTIEQNNMNRGKRSRHASSKYKGVSFGKERQKWQAEICFFGERKFLGYFDDDEEAARAYDEAAKIYHGQFAVLNFPQVAAEPPARTQRVNSEKLKIALF